MRKLEFVIFLQVLLGFSVIYDAESQLVTITSQPASPLRVLERQPLTLEWTFSVVRTFLRVEVTVSGSHFAFVEASLGAIVIRGVFLGRVSASSTQTNATITIFSLNRTDTANYVFTVFDTDGDFADAPLQLIVQYPPSLITRASDQVMLEGGPAISLTCTADGEPAPNITWTKVYANGTDSHVLSTGEQFMLPNDRTNDGTYLCKASSGIGCDVNHTINVVANFKPEKFLFTVESSDRTICKGDTINITCSAVGKPLVHTYQLFENFRLVHTSKSSVLLWSQETTNTGQTVYTCVANNTVATANSTKAIDINDHPSIEPLMNLTVKPGDNITLTCVVSGKPSPSVSWTQISTGIQHHDEAWEITNIYVDGLGEYRCNASNSCGQDNDKLTLAYMGGKCEEQCKERKTCRYFGKYLCLCERGRKGALCTKTENLALTVQAGFKLKTEEFRPEYEDLKNHRTERLISKIEEAIFEEFTGSGLTNARIVGLRKGSVIVDVELTFDAKVGMSEVSALLDEATEDRRLGEFQVSEVLVGSFIAESPTELSGTVDKDLIYALVIGVLAVMLASSVAYLIIKRKRPVREVEQLEEIDTIEESPLNLNMENGRDSEGRISAVNHAYSMELNEITNSHRTYSESEINEYAPVDPTTQSWEVSRENVEIQKVIGNGSFGRVAQGIAWNLPSKKGTTTVAIKMLKENAQEVERRDLFSELEVMKKLKPHPHVIKLLGCVTTADPVLVVIEYVPYGDLLGYLRKSRGLNDNYFNDPDIKPQRSPSSLRLMLMAWQIADGMSYLSSRKIIHRDLAARNVLVGEEEKCKVTDFGMARNVQLGRIPEKWAAYEALTRGLYTTKSDVWSFGVVLYEISTIGGQPYPQTNARDLVELLASGCRMPRPNHVSEALYEIMQSCWQKEPDDRPSFENLRRELKLKANEHTRLISMKDYDTKLYENAEDMTT